jgi:hypothetical protein
VFEGDLERFPPLLPIVLDEPPEVLRHLRLPNGTIRRWSRPRVGVDATGTPHVRIEHRPQAAGPGGVDIVANAARDIGVAHALAGRVTPPARPRCRRSMRGRSGRTAWAA